MTLLQASLSYALILILVAGGCRPRDAHTDTSVQGADKPRQSESGIIDAMTGRTAVNAGQRAKAVIDETNRQRQRQFEDALDH